MIGRTVRFLAEQETVFSQKPDCFALSCEEKIPIGQSIRETDRYSGPVTGRRRLTLFLKNYIGNHLLLQKIAALSILDRALSMSKLYYFGENI